MLHALRDSQSDNVALLVKIPGIITAAAKPKVQYICIHHSHNEHTCTYAFLLACSKGLTVVCAFCSVGTAQSNAADAAMFEVWHHEASQLQTRHCWSVGAAEL
jgi:hypothetical protein